MSIRFSFTTNPEEMTKAHEMHWRITRRRQRLIFTGIGALFLLIGAGQLLIGKIGWSSITLIFCGVFLTFLRDPLNRWSLRRHYKKRNDLDDQITWEISEDGLVGETGDIAKAEMKWELMQKVSVCSIGILAYQNYVLFYFWPRRVFENEAQYKQLVELCKRKVKDFQETPL